MVYIPTLERGNEKRLNCKERGQINFPNSAPTWGCYFILVPKPLFKLIEGCPGIHKLLT